MENEKRFITLGLVVTMVVGVLGGCGSSGSSGKTMTVSEMLETVIEDNGGEVYLYEVESGGDNKDKTFGKDMKVSDVYAYDGNNIERMSLGYGNIIKLKDVANHDVSYEERQNKREILGLDLETDETGNDVYIEAIKIDDNDGWGKEYDVMYFGGFSRIEIYDTTFMCFATNFTDYSYANPYTTTQYVLIEDTESTKDKTIVWDELGTDGILTDEVNVQKDKYCPVNYQTAD